jgi:hypothetical protein
VIYVLNKGSHALTDYFDGRAYEFPPNVCIGIPEEVARHIFGYGDDNKIPYLARHGWMKMNTDYDVAMNRLGQFSFSREPISTSHLSALVVERVAPPNPKGKAGPKSSSLASHQ